MLLSWFSLGFISQGESKQLTIIFSSNGKHHFQKALRVFKKHSLAINTDDFKLDSSSPAAFIHRIKDKIHRDYLKVFISDQEKCILTFSCRYVWKKVLARRSLFRQREQTTFITSKATVLLTNKALMIARDAVESSIGISLDVLNISLDKARSIVLFGENSDTAKIHKFKISFNNEVRQDVLEISFTDIDEETKIFLNDIPSLLNLTPSLKG
jgi:hypothetical protein